MKPLHLLFVYNANSGLFSSLTDFVHKIISPDTYNCSLCALTYNNIAMKQEWKNFLENLSADKTFLHKDEFEKQYNQKVDLPAIFYLKENQPVVLIDANEIDSYHSLDELKNALTRKIQLPEGTIA